MAKTITEERIQRLFTLAEKRSGERKDDLADRYVELAQKIGMKEEVSIPSDLRKKFCNICHSYLRPGYNCKVRMSTSGNALYQCLECGEEKQ